jgi:uncharacterized protein (TIGR02118 family)
MVKVSILYSNQEGYRFDWEYYLQSHMPLSIETSGSSLKGISVERGLSGVQPGSKTAYIALCHFAFESVEAFLKAFMPHALVLQEDIKRYTDIEPLIQFSEVQLSQ